MNNENETQPDQVQEMIDAAATAEHAPEPAPSENKFEKVVDEAEALAHRITAAVEKWFHEHLHNSVVSADTQVINHITVAKPALIAGVVAAVKAKE